MSGLFSAWNQILERTGGNRRLVLAGAAVVAVVLVWGVAHWASEPVYVTLYKDLEFADVARIGKILDDAGVPHRLGPEGKEVLVPVSEAPHARVAVAEDGHPVGGRPGLELFDKPSWGMTDFAQRVTYQRALEGELARTILAIRGIERAQVHLALPAPSLLRGSDQNARASVVLTLDPGTTLAPEAVQGVVYVVSNSVEQLSPENVAVMDNGGRLLSVPASAESQGGHSGRQMELQRSVEEALAAKIQNLLEPILGPDRVRAQVTAELSFEKVDRTIETVGPAAALAGTAAGAGSTGAAAASPDQTSSREYQRREGSVGGLTRLTAAVLVDQAALTTGGEGGAKPGIDLDKIEAMVGDAIGIDKERGDRLSVMAVPFEAAAVPADQGGVAASGSGGVNLVSLAERSVRPLVGLIAVVMIGLLALKSLRLPAPAVPSGARSAGTPTLAAPEPRPGVEPARESSTAAPAEPNLQVVRGWLNEG